MTAAATSASLIAHAENITIGDGAGVVVAPDSESTVPESNSPSDDPSGTVTETQIEKKYRELGGESGSLGAPAGPEMQLPSEAGTFRVYENGTIIWTKVLGAQVVDANVLREHRPLLGLDAQQVRSDDRNDPSFLDVIEQIVPGVVVEIGKQRRQGAHSHPRVRVCPSDCCPAIPSRMSHPFCCGRV